ncbi:MAG TPA: hypothetical protein VNY80_07480, partial [Steroidobacteraceae bacterium]|nr:hypothetical protein [Steroidobacteraceae bacterium]
TIVLPLDVAHNKLIKIEEELRQLNMKVLSFGQERESGHLSDLIEPRLESLHETLDAIRERLSDLNSDIQPTREGDRKSQLDRDD